MKKTFFEPTLKIRLVKRHNIINTSDETMRMRITGDEGVYEYDDDDYRF